MLRDRKLLLLITTMSALDVMFLSVLDGISSAYGYINCGMQELNPLFAMLFEMQAYNTFIIIKIAITFFAFAILNFTFEKRPVITTITSASCLLVYCFITYLHFEGISDCLTVVNG